MIALSIALATSALDDYRCLRVARRVLIDQLGQIHIYQSIGRDNDEGFG
jgi:hypothetical protein